jgi:hypothetical protein
MTTFDGLDDLRRAIATRKVKIEQMERSLSHPRVNPASSGAYRLIEQKQQHEMALDELQRELSRREAQMTDTGEPKLPAVTRALEPITALSGTGGRISSRPKPTQIPSDLPPYYPNDLKPQTHLIIAEAARKFPAQTHTLELCRYVISELIPHLRTAVRGKTLRADLVFPNVGELLHYLSVSNCENDDRRFRLTQEVRKSDEWLKLAQEIAGAQPGSPESKYSIPNSRLRATVNSPVAARRMEAFLESRQSVRPILPAA